MHWLRPSLLLMLLASIVLGAPRVEAADESNMNYIFNVGIAGGVPTCEAVKNGPSDSQEGIVKIVGASKDLEVTVALDKVPQTGDKDSGVYKIKRSSGDGLLLVSLTATQSKKRVNCEGVKLFSPVAGGGDGDAYQYVR